MYTFPKFCIRCGLLIESAYCGRIFVRVHWVKQRHTRRILQNGETKQEVVTERVILHQDGDEPPAPLQRNIDELAATFRAYDITPQT